MARRLPSLTRSVPWAPGLLSIDPAGYAARLAFEGLTQGEIFAALALRFPDELPQRMGQLAHGAVARVALYDAFVSGSASERIDRALIRRDFSLPEAYRYIVNVVLQARDPITGRFTGRAWRAVVVESERNLTLAELQGQVWRTIVEHYISRTSPQGELTDDWEWSARQYIVLDVSRRT